VRIRRPSGGSRKVSVEYRRVSGYIGWYRELLERRANFGYARSAARGKFTGRLRLCSLLVPPDLIALSPDAPGEQRDDGLAPAAEVHSSPHRLIRIGRDRP
jgi:hypothetical protein